LERPPPVVAAATGDRSRSVQELAQPEKIVTELATRFGNDPRVWGWQIDNELSHYGKDYCYCDSCQAKFRAWLKKKHGTIQNLNRDWGNAFWSQFYAGQSAAITRKLGRGTVTCVGVESLSGELESDLLRTVYQRAVPVENLDDGFVVDWRDGFWVATNFTHKKQRAPMAKGAKILVGTRELPPGGVTVWRE
jgi:beta-galactosidase GanA